MSPAAHGQAPVVTATPPSRIEARLIERYELLSPDSGTVHIRREVTVTTPATEYYFSPIYSGSIATVERITDRATGEKLFFDIVRADSAREVGVQGGDSTQEYIRIPLARPVPPRAWRACASRASNKT
jgi:hypothetical protein